MSNHQKKTCPNCNQIFDCNTASIALCDCTSVSLNDGERRYIKAKFNDCLCTSCMHQLKERYDDDRIQDQILQLQTCYY